MKVNVAVHGRWHGFDLANGLARRGVLGSLTTTYPVPVARHFLDASVRLHTRPLLEIRRRLWDRWRLGGKPDLAIGRAFAAFAARVSTRDADILVGWSNATLEAIIPAHAAGMKVVVERGSTHIHHQMRVLTDAYASFDIAYGDTDPEIIARELAEYEAADAIAVPTTYAAETFVTEGITRNKLIINPYGVDLTRFGPSQARPTGQKTRVLFVGRVGIQKGVPWLLRAFSKLNSQAELHLIGPIDDEARLFLHEARRDNVVLRGPLPGKRLPAEYAAADIFCLPSLQEGMPLSLLQAMASGLPSVTTSPAGSGTVHDGIEGLIVPACDSDALAVALERLIRSIEERRTMGMAAREAVSRAGGWQDYADRAIEAYRPLLAAT